MIRFSKEFKRLTYRLCMTGLFVLAAFAVGMFAYLHSLESPGPVPVKNFTAAISQAAGRTIVIHVGERKFTLQPTIIKDWVEPYTRAYSGQTDLRLSSEGIREYITKLTALSDTDPVDAKFTIENGRASVFAPSKDGQRLNPVNAATELRRQLLAGKDEIELSVQKVEAGITLATINSLGITAKIGSGESNFTGSSPSRIQNIKVAANRFSGTVIKPGGTFSFNSTLGEVEASTGYAPEKVIKDHKIEYAYGGGICQVSTTLFRAAVLAGLPIIERKPHAFPVAYYSPQGFDATIYPGISDLKFVNDTKHHLLIQSKIVGTKLQFEIYGTGDGRKVTVDGPHQYDIEMDGSMKAYLVRTVTRAGGTIEEKRFDSFYKSPESYPVKPNPYE